MSALVVRFAAVATGYDEALLTPAERDRRDRLRRPGDRAAFTAAHLLVRECAAELCGVPASSIVLEQRCPGCGATGHGRPSVAGRPDVHVSLSHSRRHAGAIAAWEPCGVDVEDTRAIEPVWRALSPRERAWVEGRADPGEAFLRLWVRKEALVKAGAAALDRLADLDVLDAPDLTDWFGTGAVGAYAVRHRGS